VSATVCTLAAILSARRPGVAEALALESSVRGADAFDRARFEAAFAAAGRRLGTEVVGPGATVTDANGRAWSIASWGLDEVGRVLLLLEALAHVPESEQVAWVEGHHRAGALRERQAVLRALALLPEPARFLAIALDACRSSTQPVFEAIACDNPYPAAYFPEASFNQVVLKAVFTEVALARIVDLTTRLTPELARMASDYADERAAAGRRIPTDLALLTIR
jgi:hypothetical protein